MPSAVHDINSAFNERLKPVGSLRAARPVNPFASTGVQTSETKRAELDVRSAVTLSGKLGSQYKGSVVDTKDDDSFRFDTYSVSENPKANITKHSTSRLEVEHTRER